MVDISIINTKAVNENQIKDVDLYIENGRIKKISSGLPPLGKVIDAQGMLLFPGVIDDQVHFREPGLTNKGNINSESKAAVAGGTTSYMDMPNVLPPTLNHSELEKKNQIASKDSLANYSFYLGATNTNIEEIKSIDPSKTCGIKIFMGSSTGDLLVDNAESLESIFRESKVVITTHCEDSPMIRKNEEIYGKRFGENIPVKFHSDIRSRESCLKSTTYAINLAKKFNSQLHVLHVSTKEELDLFNSGSVENKKITAEACIPHLFFSSKDYELKGSLIKCNPSIKELSDQLALRNALKTGKIDYVATDHAPHTLEEKRLSYLYSPSGMPSVQHTLLSVIDLVDNKVLSLEEVPKVTSHNVAIRFNVKERGFIREGYWADLVLVERGEKNIVRNSDTLYKCGWSPFEGYTFKSRINETIINGIRVYSNGEFLTNSPGKRLEFGRERQ